MQPDLLEKLRAIAVSPLLLVACDYDGTLAPLVDDRDRAFPDAGAVRALRVLRALPWTTTSIISGRSVGVLRGFLGDDCPALIAGSHGAEWMSAGVALTGDQRSLLLRVTEDLVAIASVGGGLSVERKPASAALHYRGVDDAVAQKAIARAIERCGGLAGVRVKPGNKVLELLVVDANKGEALRRARHACGASAVLFVGDDPTDEDAFRVLQHHDCALKVGEGESIANHRVADVGGVAEALRTLAELRGAWATSRRLVPLERCAVISDQRTAAVVTPKSGGACVEWMCLPRFDSPALFASLLGDESAGSFEVRPVAGDTAPETTYDGDSMVLVTRWGGLRVTDYLDCSAGRAYQKAGRTDLVRVIEGSGRARIRFAPRLDFGRVATQLHTREDGLVVDGSNDPVVLRSPGVHWGIHSDGTHQTAEAIVDASAGPVVLELRYGTANLRDSGEAEPQRRSQNLKFWAGWAASLRVPRCHSGLVRRSALVLKSLCYGPTGAITAAATTSLPELFGGVRNWDYRFCWPRDAALTATALVRLGNTGHALKLLDWLTDVVDRCESPDRLRPIYTVGGSHLPSEAELGHLEGFAQSRPVRIGNAAANQVQLDVFGPIVNLVATLAEHGAPITPEHWRLVRAMVRAVEARWREPDHGIWEMRLERRHHVHSKVMCWHTVQRALVVEDMVHAQRNSEWAALADTIRADVLTHGWNERAEAFTGAYGHDYADAAALAVGLTGLLPHDDPRWRATVDFVARTLMDSPTVRRYRVDDGLPGEEGGMHICTGWMIESLLTLGRTAEAARLLDGLAGMFGSAGVLSEQYDAQSRVACGNLAQAYSHLAFIHAAIAMDAAAPMPPGAPTPAIERTRA